MTSEESQHVPQKEAIGQQLKRAREQHGLTVSQIADAQHLRSGVIQAIENGDYHQIDSELFLKGYVRAYARQVGLDGDDLIACLNLELQPAREQRQRELEASPLVDIERRRSRKRKIAKLLLLIAAVAIAGAFLVMYLLPEFGVGQPAAGQADVREQAPAGDADIGPATVDPVVLDQPVVVQDVSDEAPTADVVPTVALENPELPLRRVDAPSDAAVATDLIENAPAPVDEGPEITAPAVSQAPEAVSEPAATQLPVIEAPAQTTVGRLEIAFTDDCWVRVQDATGNRLANSLQRAGDVLSVSGEAPLTVVVGAVSAVETIRFQGELLDIGVFPVTNNRIEFTLQI